MGGDGVQSAGPSCRMVRKCWPPSQSRLCAARHSASQAGPNGSCVLTRGRSSAIRTWGWCRAKVSRGTPKVGRLQGRLHIPCSGPSLLPKLSQHTVSTVHTGPEAPILLVGPGGWNADRLLSESPHKAPDLKSLSQPIAPLAPSVPLPTPILEVPSPSGSAGLAWPPAA